MSYLTTFLQENSALIASILGILGALSGVVITSYYNSKNNNKKINFDLLDRDRERKFNLRKEIYLDAVDSIVEFESIIGGIATAKSLDKFNEFHRNQTKKLKKLELISDMNISLKVAELSSHFRYLINYILSVKLPLLSEEEELSQIIEKIKSVDVRIDWFEGGGAKNYNEKALKEAQLEYINMKKLREKMSKEVSLKFQDLFSKQEQLGVYLLEYFGGISELIGSIYNGFRLDFGLDLFDDSKYDLKKQIELRNKINKNFTDVMDNIRGKTSNL